MMKYHFYMEINELTEIIIGCCYEVYNSLGYGFLEKVYENALCVELKQKKIKVEQQKKLTVFYKEEIVGEYIADLIVDDRVVVELKTIEKLAQIHRSQVLNYIKATNKKLGLLINFSPVTVEVKRIANGV